MEVDDADVDSALLQQFSCLGTNDKEALITQFHKLVGNSANEQDAAFYLDMNNWNLQEAVGAYFDLQKGTIRAPPLLTLLDDVTIGDGEGITPCTAFVKAWRVKNAGREPWPDGCSLQFMHGDRLSDQLSVPLPALLPDHIGDVCIQMRSPASQGVYQSKWRATTQTGLQFGDIIWVIVSVQEDGLLGVTQQMTRLSELGTGINSAPTSAAACSQPPTTPAAPASSPAALSPIHHQLPDGTSTQWPVSNDDSEMD